MVIEVEPLTPAQEAAKLCKHCASGHAPRWQAHSREWVHVRSPAIGARTTGFSITLCLARKGEVG